MKRERKMKKKIIMFLLATMFPGSPSAIHQFSTRTWLWAIFYVILNLHIHLHWAKHLFSFFCPFFLLTKCWPKKNLIPENVDPKFFLPHYIFDPPTFLHPQICWPPKIVDPKQMLTPQHVWPPKIFDPQNILAPQHFWPPKSFDLPKILTSQSFWPHLIFDPKHLFYPWHFLTPNIFWPQNCLPPTPPN